jgi:hypothetical protein
LSLILPVAVLPLMIDFCAMFSPIGGKSGALLPSDLSLNNCYRLFCLAGEAPDWLALLRYGI